MNYKLQSNAACRSKLPRNSLFLVYCTAIGASAWHDMSWGEYVHALASVLFGIQSHKRKTILVPIIIFILNTLYVEIVYVYFVYVQVQCTLYNIYIFDSMCVWTRTGTRTKTRQASSTRTFRKKIKYKCTARNPVHAVPNYYVPIYQNANCSSVRMEK